MQRITLLPGNRCEDRYLFILTGQFNQPVTQSSQSHPLTFTPSGTVAQKKNPPPLTILQKKFFPLSPRLNANGPVA
jgi:hypothetical protein